MEPEIKVNVEMLTALTDNEKATWFILGMVFGGIKNGCLDKRSLIPTVNYFDVTPEKFEEIVRLSNKVSEEILGKLERIDNGANQE